MSKDQTISIVVKTTRGSGTFSFEKTAKVEEVIQTVREHFELTGDGTFTLIRSSDQEQLVPVERTLVSFGLEDGDELVLTGGGTNV